MGKPRKPRLPDFNGLSIPELAFLLWGRNRGAKWAPGAYEDADEAWGAHENEILHYWTDPAMAGVRFKLPIRGGPTVSVGGPGTRPFYWWHRTARHPRLLVRDDGTTERLFKTNWGRGLKFDWDRSRGRFAFGLPTPHPPGTVFESEGTYLARLDRLRPDETYTRRES